MKIGDAGEAFFVFETDEDVPEELITSPLLQATTVGEPNSYEDTPTGRFGAKEDEEGLDESTAEPRNVESDMDGDVSRNFRQHPLFRANITCSHRNLIF
jgi:phosphatidate phosphatase LPIN